MRETEQLLQPGEFAARANLSPKALRIYAEQGLLEPAHVDERNGYRYYAQSQLDLAYLVGLLRRLGLPLRRIGDLLKLDGPDMAREIGRWWNGVEADVRTRRELVGHLDRYLTGRQDQMYDVRLRDTSDHKVLSTQRHVTVDDLDDFIDSASRAIRDHLDTHGLQPGALRVVYHGMVTEDSDGPVEVTVPFTGSVDPVGDIGVRPQPAGQEAYTTLTRSQGEFPGILSAYDAVGHWIDSHGMHRAGSPAEVYLADRDATGPDEPYFDVAWPAAAP